MPPEACEAFDCLKAVCLQAPIPSFPDFSKPFLLETDASGKGLGAVLPQKQFDGRYHPIAYASHIMTETEQRYHSNKQEFLALKWAVTEQFHEYLSPYGKNRNEFVVRTDNNPLTYFFSTANLDAAGQRWVAHLTSYNFALEYQKGKDNTVTDFLSCMDDCLTEGKVQDYLSKIPYPGVKAVLDNAVTPLVDRTEQGVRPNPGCQKACQEGTLDARPARLATTNVIDWKLDQKEDPVLYQVVKHQKASRKTFKEALLKVTDQKATMAYVKSKEQLIMKNGLLYRQSKQGPIKEIIFQFVVPQIHRSAALDGCHHEAVHQGQCYSLSLMQEQFWWPGMAHNLRNRIKKCGHCRKFEAAPPIAPLKPLTCSGPGESLHMDFTSIKETVPLQQEPVIRNVMVMQDHFSKYVIAYVVKDQTARTATETLRSGYFGLFGASAYLVSDQGKAFIGHLITNLCELYGVQKLRTSPYHAQTNGQVEWMNQTIIRMIGKLEQDKKACWSEHLLEMLAAYYGTRSTVTGYSPYFLLFGRKARMPVDYLFPTLHNSPHQTKMEVSVAAMQERLKEAFAVARHLTSQEAAKQWCYYDRKAGAVALQPGDVVMVCTDGFVGKWKVKDWWEDGGFIVESQLEDWPVYKVRCLTTDAKQKPKYWILHRNHLLLVTNEDDTVIPGQRAQAKVTPTISNATLEASVDGKGLFEHLPSLVTRQEGDMTSQVWLNGEFHTKPWTQTGLSKAPESSPDQIEDEVSDLKPDLSDSELEGT